MGCYTRVKGHEKRLCVAFARRLCEGCGTFLFQTQQRHVLLTGGSSSHLMLCCIIAAVAPHRAWPQLHARAHVCVCTHIDACAGVYISFTCELQHAGAQHCTALARYSPLAERCCKPQRGRLTHKSRHARAARKTSAHNSARTPAAAVGGLA